MAQLNYSGNYIKKFTDIPVDSLNRSSRLMLAKHLNPPRSTCSSTGYVQDKDGLAELMGFNYQDCKNYELKSDYTCALLEDWSQKQGSTISLLWQHLEQLERYDILEDELLITKICDDVKKWKHYRQLQAQAQPMPVQEIQDPEVTSGDMPTDHDADEYRNITINECRTGVPEFFDAFVCYTSEDFPFVLQMINMLEGRHGLKLCICNRDLTAGTSRYTTMAKLIEKRCKKMIIVLSPAYVKSDECDFQTKFAHSLSPGSRSKKLIPVLIKHPCNPPNILRHITPVDYTKCDLVEWFWERLARSLEESSYGTPDDDLNGPGPPAIPMQTGVLTISSSSTSLFSTPSTSSTTLSSPISSMDTSAQDNNPVGLQTSASYDSISDVSMEIDVGQGTSSCYMPPPSGKRKKDSKTEKKKGTKGIFNKFNLKRN